MTNINKYKPRYTLAHLTKSKIWPYKDSYLRNFFRIRARWVKPKGKVQKYIIVAKNRKWTEARNFFRPNSIRIGKKLIFGKSAYGRPQAASRRYSNLFYIKQKLRAFYGKVKEDTFLNLFKIHKLRMSVQTSSFFISLESRLDRLFFRMRLLPTVFACHQFIHYNGLEINNQREKSPRKEIKIGDVVTVPTIAWIAFYWHTYYRIYYRRWGRYIFKRRLIKKVKKILSFNFGAKSYVNKAFVTERKYHMRDIKSMYMPKFKSIYFINKLQNVIGFFDKHTIYGVEADTNMKDNAIQIVESGATNLIITENTKILSQFSTIIAKLRQELKAINDKEGISILEEEVKKLQQLFIKVKQYQKLYINSFFFSEWKERYHQKRTQSDQIRNRKQYYRKTDRQNNSKKRQGFITISQKWKLKNYTFQPSKLNLKRNINLSWSKIRSGIADRRSIIKKDRERLIRLFWNIVKKSKRKQITTRLKPVHFFIPSYLQVDFRTLSFIKIKSPTYRDIHYPFQISPSKTYSFYKSQGF